MISWEIPVIIIIIIIFQKLLFHCFVIFLQNQSAVTGLSCNSPSSRFTSLSTSLPSHPPFPAPHYLLLGIR